MHVLKEAEGMYVSMFRAVRINFQRVARILVIFKYLAAWEEEFPDQYLLVGYSVIQGL